MAHAAMLGKQGIIAKEESDKIIEGLKGILVDIEAGKIHFSQDYEDIHMNVEQILTERIGDAGKPLTLRADRLFAAAVAFSVGSVRSQVLRLDIVGKLYL